MIEDYYIYQQDIEKKYGEDSTIFMMVGSFYELYQYEHMGKAKTVSPLLNLSLTKRNKNIPSSKTNPYMCGFPAHCLKKYLDILIKQYQYTVGIVDQFDIEASNKKQRELCKIYSPCIPYDLDEEEEDSHIMIINIQKQKKNHLSKDERYFFSFILMNLSIGNIYYNDTDYSNLPDIKKDILKIIREYNVKEIIWIGENKFGLDEDIKVYNHETIDGRYRTLDYQKKVLSRVYNEEIGLEKHPNILEYLVFLFDFIYDHLPLLLSKIQPPKLYFFKDNLHYQIHSYYELNIINTPKLHKKKNRSDMSLIDLLDKTTTKMGSRHLHHMIFKPIYNTKELSDRYDRVKYYIDHYDKTLAIRKQLMNICDIEKKIRKFSMNSFMPMDMYHIINSIFTIHTGPDIFTDIFTDMNGFLDDCKEMWDITTMNNNYDANFYNSPISQASELSENKSFLEDFITRYNICQIKSTNDEIYVHVNKKKWNNMTNKPENISTIEISANSYKLHSLELARVCSNIISLQNELKNVLKIRFKKDVEWLIQKYSLFLQDMILKIKEIDVFTTFAYISIKYKYTRPVITDKTSSHVYAKGMRHPIIEQINDTEPFITNDVFLSENIFGNLIYGLNSAGKSTFLKSIGLNVIMAQIGMFVPADEFYFYPFQSLYSKIFVMDDIYKGQSTFIYELNELKYILGHSDQNSLVLCDELTSGTETWSATGILISTILSLIRQSSRFVLTSHLHTLNNFPEIINHQNINIFHFNVSMDPSSLHFHHKLLPGMGGSLYGIEIAEALSFPGEFVKCAFDYRNKISRKQTGLCPNKKSRYNKKLIVDKCEECGAIENLHTHHKVPQKESDENGFIGHYHKNKLFNLQILCETCHTRLHHN